jgi:hypothetical protein
LRAPPLTPNVGRDQILALPQAQNLFKISIKGCSARQNRAKKWSIHEVFEHLELDFSAAMRSSARA